MMDLLKNTTEGQCFEGPEHDETSDQEPKITHAVGYESFFSRQGIFHPRPAKQILVIPETDQEERTQAYSFPTDKKHQVVIRCHQDHHGGDKQVKENKEALVAAQIILESNIFMHITDGINMDQGPDTGDNQHHGR